MACALAALGVPFGWVSAVGDDPFGHAVVASVAEAGTAGSAMRYYRAGSSASALGPELVDRLDLDAVSYVHLTGITPPCPSPASPSYTPCWTTPA